MMVLDGRSAVANAANRSVHVGDWIVSARSSQKSSCLRTWSARRGSRGTLTQCVSTASRRRVGVFGELQTLRREVQTAVSMVCIMFRFRSRLSLPVRPKGVQTAQPAAFAYSELIRGSKNCAHHARRKPALPKHCNTLAHQSMSTVFGFGLNSKCTDSGIEFQHCARLQRNIELMSVFIRGS